MGADEDVLGLKSFSSRFCKYLHRQSKPKARV